MSSTPAPLKIRRKWSDAQKRHPRHLTMVLKFSRSVANSIDLTCIAAPDVGSFCGTGSNSDMTAMIRYLDHLIPGPKSVAKSPQVVE
ncbi:hypothetical protein TNCV_1031071 [Trichonephila clavipes]|nr:hypothetical protein TNCV_1031071 [Trichonephila clavipes]